MKYIIVLEGLKETQKIISKSEEEITKPVGETDIPSEKPNILEKIWNRIRNKIADVKRIKGAEKEVEKAKEKEKGYNEEVEESLKEKTKKSEYKP